MKVLQIIQKPQLRGAEIFACQLSNHLINLGHEVKIVSLFPGMTTLPFEGQIIQLNRPASKRMFDLQGWRQLNDVIRALSPDIVQANAGDTLKFASMSRRIFRWKSALVFRNANKVSDFIDSAAKKIFNRFLLGQATHVISVSELCRRDFINTFSWSPVNVSTVPIGIERIEVSALLPTDLREWVNDDQLIVNVGSLVPEKNHIALLRMMQRLKSKGLNMKLIIVGDGRLRELLAQYIMRHDLGSNVRLAGYRSDAIQIIASATVFALPSLIEGLPGVILEAMYCKIPVVSYDVGGISEVVVEGETGRLTRKGDEEAFVEALETALRQGGTMMIEKAFNNVTANFTNEVIAGRFVSVYKSIVS